MSGCRCKWMPSSPTLSAKILFSWRARTLRWTRRIIPISTKACRRGPSATRASILSLPRQPPSSQNTFSSSLTNRETSIMLSPMRSIGSTKQNTSTKGRVFVGLSGGVDSAVSAALLQQQGYEVTGVFIRIALPGYPCAGGQDKLDAMRVAAHLRIPFKELDLSREYKKKVFEIAIKEFEKVRTPNPDALCNREIKFGLFFDYCIVQGADYVATGHYARVVRPDPALPAVELHAGADEDKDQSYFLWAVDERKLRKTLFPLGDIKKTEVRALAKKLRLPNAERKDSQGLCFLGPISMSDMLRRV